MAEAAAKTLSWSSTVALDKKEEAVPDKKLPALDNEARVHLYKQWIKNMQEQQRSAGQMGAGLEQAPPKRPAPTPNAGPNALDALITAQQLVDMHEQEATTSNPSDDTLSETASDASRQRQRAGTHSPSSPAHSSANTGDVSEAESSTSGHTQPLKRGPGHVATLSDALPPGVRSATAAAAPPAPVAEAVVGAANAQAANMVKQAQLASQMAAGSMLNSQMALMDMQMQSVLREYALRRAQLITSATPFVPIGSAASAAPAAPAAPSAAPPTPRAVAPVLPPAAPVPAPSAAASARALQKPCASLPPPISLAAPPAGRLVATTKAARPEKIAPKRKAESDPWLIKSWAVKGPTQRMDRMRWSTGVRWQAKRAKTDASSAPPRPFGVHMVCMAANETKEGGCGCRQTGDPLMEHNGVSGIGEWHVVTQPHFNCARGSFRPAIFVTECGAESCSCLCHTPGSGLDSADCDCKGEWKRASGSDWVKTTTAPTANSWKDRRTARERAKNEKALARAVAARADGELASEVAGGEHSSEEEQVEAESGSS